MLRGIVKGAKLAGNMNGKKKLVEVIETVIVLPLDPKQHRLVVTAAGVALDDVPVGTKGKKREAMGQASSGVGEARSRVIFDGLIGELERKISSFLTKDLEFYQALGVEGFYKYLNKLWKVFFGGKEVEDWLEASLACLICLVAAQMKSLVAIRELKKKEVDASEAISRSDQIKQYLGSTLALAKKRKKVEAETIRDSVLAEKEDLAKKLQEVEASFVANFHLTKAYTSFSNYFASVGQQEVISVLHKEHPNFDLSSLEAKFHPIEVEDPLEE
ncbi:hypothetical protein Adt_05655 [Abeliophyllum distichum]|uniref:Uncharacterized protein n=1 Tax=Abeliophyllum distichum TaxID=126358 RepID=A0ABD1V4P8_9LAMI